MEIKLSDNLRRLRKARGLTQQKLAQKAGVSLIVVTNVEQGLTKDPAMSSLIKLADTMGITIDELIGRVVPKRS
ncbi:MAG: helix-turn-helix transcriptional regulator [Elusimicrobia bacterium]|nr:helix-turn-helix transcriptional regulator [Elusimicrobiota bacterium]MBK7689237.1 helix-turn-helix transcriptional regulator [Elusimicrobiota bacterium]MBK8651442.1 helix-turn-helix transcriptional regulator [Elusimicrobiota bacterium]